MNILTNFRATGTENESPYLHTVRGTKVTVSSATEQQFYTYYNTEDKKWYVNELTTGLAISQSEVSENDALFEAEQTICKAKKEGVYYKRLNIYLTELEENGITTPINKRIATA